MFKFIWSEKLNCYFAEHNPTIRADRNGNIFGGGKTSIEQPSPPAQPSTAEAIDAWVKSLPQIYETQMQYAPMEAAQQVSLAQQYAAPLGQAYLAAQKEMYPETTALQENLAKQAEMGMSSEVPDWMRREYLSNLNAQLGTNVSSGIGADYVSRGLLEQKKGWQDYYRDLALSVAGRQPLVSATTPSYSNYMAGYTPQTTMDFMNQGYGSYAGLYGSMYGANAQMAQMNSPYAYMSGIGNLMSGVGSFGTGMGWGKGK